MAVTKKNILNRFHVVLLLVVILLIAIMVQLATIQFVDGEKYRGMSEHLTIKHDTIFANKGSVFSIDGSLLATSMSQYEIRMDVVTVNPEVFEKNVKSLAENLSKMLGKSTSYWETKLKKARSAKSRYLLIAKGLGYNDYVKIKSFPIFNLGVYKGGFIAQQTTVRAHPFGKIAERTIGYNDERGSPGIEGAYSDYLNGENGLRLKQKIAKGQWKPIGDNNEKEPINGKDIVTTIDVNIQDIAHHSLLRQLEFYKAEHGCVVVMETKTGEIRAISNLGRTSKGTYYESRNYAVYESHEPGSAFKLMALVAALESGKVDTSTVVDTGNGKYLMYGRYISDSHQGGYGKISFARSLEVSSNIAFARVIEENFGKNPNEFIDILQKMNVTDKLFIKIKGEGSPEIPRPGDAKWSKNALPSMAYGYNLRLTPLQTLTFYNAIANNGEMVKPRFVKEVRSWDKHVETFDKVVINPKICSDETIAKVQEVLKNVVKRGTGRGLNDEDFSMAGKTGTARVEYGNYEEWLKDKKYISSFTGYFPAEDPMYSCIVVIHKPDAKTGFYGADVSGPVFKDIAEKIYTSNHVINEIINEVPQFKEVDESYITYNKISDKELNTIPNVVGMAGMDAISLLENMGLNVGFEGQGKVVEQSINAGEKLVKGTTIIIKLT